MSNIKADNFTWKTGETTGQSGTTVTGSQVVYGVAKSWCNYNGVSPGIRASFNTSSVTKGATAKYQFFFSVACADANFSFSGSATAANETGGSDGVRWLSSGSTYHSYVGRTSSDIKTVVAYDSANVTDGLNTNIAINR
jgi:hypothetical protein